MLVRLLPLEVETAVLQLLLVYQAQPKDCVRCLLGCLQLVLHLLVEIGHRLPD